MIEVIGQAPEFPSFAGTNDVRRHSRRSAETALPAALWLAAIRLGKGLIATWI
jgi:hypothetical protein